MPKTHRITGLSKGAIDIDSAEVHFTLGSGISNQLVCIAKIGIADQITSALARMSLELRKHLKGQTTAAEDVFQSEIVREMSGKILMRLTSDKGIPYTFALDDESASGISEALKAVVEQGPRPVGHA